MVLNLDPRLVDLCSETRKRGLCLPPLGSSALLPLGEAQDFVRAPHEWYEGWESRRGREHSIGNC